MIRVFPESTSRVANRARVTALQRQLLAWYRRNRRDLPWRRTRDPYRIWVSEVMLQQTQIATVLPFYQSFIDRFPSVDRLARARESDVLAAWSGLGYYRRARHLHAAARRVMNQHAGEIPRDEPTFGALPGVGPYTRGAVLSIAFDLSLPVLDGNVARVLSRWWALPVAVRDPGGAKVLWRLAGTLVPMRSPGDWNQALMELGALICTPRSPQCTRCPLRSSCAAFARREVHRFPPATKRKPAVVVRKAVAMVRSRGRWLLVRRSGSVLTGLWEPPTVELRGQADAASRPPSPLVRELDRLGVRAKLVRVPQRVRHRIMSTEFLVDIWAADVPVARREPHAPVRWVQLQNPSVPLTGLARKLARVVAREQA